VSRVTAEGSGAGEELKSHPRSSARDGHPGDRSGTMVLVMAAHDLDLERTPLLDDSGRAMLRRLREHPDAPHFTYAVGDRLVAADLGGLDRFREHLARGRGRRAPGPPLPGVLQRLATLRHRVPYLAEVLPADADLERDWDGLPTTCRDDLARAPWRFVPDDEPLDRVIIYRTAGTTGHPISVPHHPFAVACYLPLLEHALASWGVRLEPRPDEAACFLASAQIRTYTYATVLSAWHGAGFAKVNLRPTEWPRGGSCRSYFESFAPSLVTGEPVALAELAALAPAIRPAAMVSTSLALAPTLQQQLAARFGCPVVDWYSAVETGPVAYGCPRGLGLHLLSHDLHVEVLRPDGSPSTAGERGEIAVSGGRNPLLPLFRYRTGDSGRLLFEGCPCGETMPRLVDLEGRRPILFRALDGTPVGAVDISRRLRELPVLRHAFAQRDDFSCELAVAPRPDGPPAAQAELRAAMTELFGDLPLTIRVDPRLGEDPDFVAFRSELPFPGEASDGD
jgi:phenylacetate-CoA ligase